VGEIGRSGFLAESAAEVSSGRSQRAFERRENEIARNHCACATQSMKLENIRLTRAGSLAAATSADHATTMSRRRRQVQPLLGASPGASVG
jgi:hypothetical protein